jgi:dihydrofolate synthase/folylpolyglutamate synthase
VIVDAAHNPHGAAVLASAIAESFNFEYIIGVVSVMADKDVSGVLEALSPVFDEVVLTHNGSPRAMEVSRLRTIAEGVFPAERIYDASDMISALDLAIARADELGGSAVGVVATGSVVTASAARALFGGRS